MVLGINPYPLLSMRTFKIPWRPLLMTAGLLSTMGAMAQYIQVPNGCTVVDPGGATCPNQVGPDGIITMPDNYAGGTFTFVGGTSVEYWHARGDLSFSSTGLDWEEFSVTSQMIKSYNARPHPTWEGSTGRSKGAIIVKYKTEGNCSEYLNVHVYKTFGAPLPSIVGPQCIVLGASATYSVAPIVSDNLIDGIGTDLYYWKLTNADGSDLLVPEANLSYLASDRSSITVRWTGTAFTNWYASGNKGPYKLCCYYGRANTWTQRGTNTNLNPGTLPQDNGSCMELGAAAVNPITDRFLCAHNDNNSVVYPFTPKAGYSYTWSTPTPGWQVSPGPGANQVTITGILTTDHGILRVAVRDACNNVTDFSVNVNHQLPELPRSVPSCMGPGEQFTVTVPAGVSMNDLCMLATKLNDPNFPVPLSWPVQQSGRTLTFTLPPGTCAGTYSMSIGFADISAGASVCRCGVSAAIVNVRPAAPTLSGPACTGPDGTTTVRYTASGSCGANAYVWNNTLGMTPGPNANTTTPYIDYTPSGIADGNVTVTARLIINPNGDPNAVNNNCYSSPTTLAVNRSLPVPEVLHEGHPSEGDPDVLCFEPGIAKDLTLSIANPVAGATYTWQFRWRPIPTDPSSNTSNTEVGNPVEVTTPSNMSGNSEADCTVTVTSGDCSNSYTFKIYECGKGGLIAPPLQEGHDRGGSIQLIDAPGSGIRISPNPNDGTFTLGVTRDFKQGTVTVTDGQGRTIGTARRLAKGVNQLRYESLAPGTYLVRVELDGKVETRSVVITAK